MRKEARLLGAASGVYEFEVVVKTFQEWAASEKKESE